MKYFVAMGALALATVAGAQAPVPVPDDCTAKNPCAVTIDNNGRTTTAHASPAGTFPPTARATSTNITSNDFYRETSGPDILTLAEAAVSYLAHVAQGDAIYPGGGKPFDPNNVFWDRGELTDAEAAEVLNLARRAVTPEAKQAEHEKAKSRHRLMCQELGRAGSADAQLAALQRSARRSVDQQRAVGQALLDQLSASTRASVLRVVAEHRKGITVNRPDWQKLRTTQPEALEMHRARACVDMN